jgi:hypothetical protein
MFYVPFVPMILSVMILLSEISFVVVDDFMWSFRVILITAGLISAVITAQLPLRYYTNIV